MQPDCGLSRRPGETRRSNVEIAVREGIRTIFGIASLNSCHQLTERAVARVVLQYRVGPSVLRLQSQEFVACFLAPDAVTSSGCCQQMESAMKGFIFGIVTMIVILALGLLFALTGFVSRRADKPLRRWKRPSPGTPWTRASHELPPKWRIPSQRTRRSWSPALVFIAGTACCVTAIWNIPNRRSPTCSILLPRSS